MKIETTARLREEHIEHLDRAAEMLRVTRTALIVEIMGRMMKEHARRTASSGRVRYQDDAKTGWRPVHFSIYQREYDFFQEMRKFYRCSVSRLIAIAVQRHLWAVLKAMTSAKTEEDADNYPFKHHVFSLQTLEGAVCWKIYWGFPVDHRTIIQPAPG